MNAPKGYPCDLTGCAKEPILDVDQCVQKFCWSSPNPPNPSNSNVLTVLGVSIVSIILITVIVYFRKKIAAVCQNNDDEDPPIGQEALQDEINQDLDGRAPIYNPTTSRGFPNNYYSALETDDEVSDEE